VQARTNGVGDHVGIHSPTVTLTARRPGGGVMMRLMSRTPLMAICMVRGMGVAESVSTSDLLAHVLELLLVLHAEALLLVDDDSPRS